MTGLRLCDENVYRSNSAILISERSVRAYRYYMLSFFVIFKLLQNMLASICNYPFKLLEKF
jgi:hypothetical protein